MLIGIDIYDRISLGILIDSFIDIVCNILIIVFTLDYC